MKHRIKLEKLIPFCLLGWPAFLLGILILKYSVNVPFWDQWIIASIFEKAYDGSLSFSELMVQHNESRKVFTKLVYIFLAHLTHWNVKYEMLLVFLLACVISFNCYRLLKITVTSHTRTLLLLGLLINLLLFSPMQNETWLWGIQVDYMMPSFCITTCMVVAYSSLRTIAKFVLCMILATISTFSYANGLLCWVVVFPVLIFINWKDFIKAKWLAILWIGGFASNLGLYFYNYQKPSNTPSFLFFLSHRIEAIQFFFSFLGSPLGRGLIYITSFKRFLGYNIFIGFLLVVLFLGAIFYIFKNINFKIAYQGIGWLMIGSFSILSGMITTLGRVGFGIDQSFVPRYITFAQYLTIAIITLTTIVFKDAIARGYLAKNQKLISRIALGLSAILLLFYYFNLNEGIKGMESSKVDRLQGKACLSFINIVPENDCISKKVFGNVTYVKDIANILNRLDLLSPPLINSGKIQYIEGIGKRGKYGNGRFEMLHKENNQVYTAAGWAILPGRGEPADVVVLTYEKAKGENIMFAVSDTRVKRKDVKKATKNRAYSMSGWRKSFEVSNLPKGAVKINAWAFDANMGKAFKLKNTLIMRN